MVAYSGIFSSVIKYTCTLCFQDGTIRCGGNGHGLTCLTFTAGTWNESHRIHGVRVQHTSWRRPDGAILLLGGEGNFDSSALLRKGERSVPSFNLRHESM